MGIVLQVRIRAESLVTAGFVVQHVYRKAVDSFHAHRKAGDEHF